jgi:hypothetical protein
MSPDITGIFGIVFSFGSAIAIVALALRHSARKLEHTEIMKALEQGKELPSIEIKKRYNYLNDLRLGIIFLSIGIGALLWLLAVQGIQEINFYIHYSIAYVPISIGIGYLMMAALLKTLVKNGNGS